MSLSASFFAAFSGVPGAAGGSGGALKDSGRLWLAGAASETEAEGGKKNPVR